MRPTPFTLEGYFTALEGSCLEIGGFILVTVPVPGGPINALWNNAHTQYCTPWSQDTTLARVHVSVRLLMSTGQSPRTNAPCRGILEC